MSLNPAQRIAVESADSDILVLAGAGSGKTKTLIARTERLIQAGTRPDKLLLLTFTKKAGEEMRSRLRMTFGDAANRVNVWTFHSWAMSWIRSRPHAFVNGNFKVAKDHDAQDLMDIAREAVVDVARDWLQTGISGGQRLITADGGHERQANKEEALDRIRQLDELPESSTLVEWYSYFRNTAPSNQDFREFLLERHHVRTVYQADVLQGVAQKYQDEKQSQGYLDYDDLLTQFLFAIATDDSPLRREVKQSYEHILVDELQDTSPLQWRLLQEARNPANLFCVGDDAQSIYRFRDADYLNVHHFKTRLHGARILKLTDNYRSTQEILDLSNWLLLQSKVNYDKRLSAVRGAGPKPLLMRFTNPFDEAAVVADEIQEVHALGEPLQSCMAMARRSFDLKPLEGELLRREIPYVLIGGKSFLETKHIRDLLSLVLAANNHRDKLAWRRMLQLLDGVGRKTATQTADTIGALTASGAALKLLETNKNTGLQHAARLVRAVQPYSSPQDAVRAAREVLQPVLSQLYPDYRQRARDFEILEGLAEHHRSLLGFLDAYALEAVTQSQAAAKKEDHVTLITCHSAKGTERQRVFLICAGPGRFPDSKAEDSEEIEEERRILYVALTRAKDFLTITTSTPPDHDWFLDDLPPDLVQTGDPWLTSPRAAFA